MYTQHAQVRCQQRGISREIVDVLLSFGTYRYRHGAEVYYMDRLARDQAAKVRAIRVTQRSLTALTLTSSFLRKGI